MTPAILACSALAEDTLNQLVQEGIPCHHAEVIAEAITAYRVRRCIPHPTIQLLMRQYRAGIQRSMILPRGILQ